MSPSRAVSWRSMARRLSDESGQALVEYSMILVFASIVAVAALTNIGHGVISLLSSVVGMF